MSWPVHQACLQCRECLLSKTDGLCPIRLCPKSLVSGPCGGSVQGKCEINSSATCVWHAIYDHLIKADPPESLPRFYKDYARPMRLSQGGMSHAIC